MRKYLEAKYDKVTRKTYLQFGFQQIRCVPHKLKQQNSKMVENDIPSHRRKTVVNPWKFHRIKSIPKFSLQTHKFPSINPNVLNVSLSVYKTTLSALSYISIMQTSKMKLIHLFSPTTIKNMRFMFILVDEYVNLGLLGSNIVWTCR